MRLLFPMARLSFLLVFPLAAMLFAASPTGPLPLGAVRASAENGVFAAAGDLDSAAARLAEEVVRCGAPDNYSFVLVGT